MNARLTVLHLANFNSTNIGNGALIRGTESVVSEDIPASMEWIPVPWDDYTFGLLPFDENFVDRINQSDGMIVNGAVTFNGREYLSHAGMRFDLPFHLWEKIKKPLIFYGVSYRHWPHQLFHHVDRLQRALEVILERSDMILGVRNDGTKAWLESVCGMISEKIVEIPDMGMFVSGEAGDYPQFRRDKKNLIIAFNNEDAPNRYGLGEEGGESSKTVGMSYEDRRRRVLKHIAKALERLLEKWSIQIILVPHYFDDYQMMSEFVTLLRPRIAHQHTVSTGLLPVQATACFYGMYQQADAVISMRVHSMSPSIGLGVPMVPVVTQDRMWTYLKKAGLEDIGIHAFDNDLDERLYHAVDALLSEPEPVVARFTETRARFREQCKAFNLTLQSVLRISK